MKKQWSEKEKNDASAFNAKRTPRSGGLWFAKGDSKSDDFLIENKTTGLGKNFTIKGDVWDKIEREALLSSRIPVLSIEFGPKKKNLVILDQNDFISLLEKVK